MYILGIGPEFLPTTVIVDYIIFCSQLFYCYFDGISFIYVIQYVFITLR